MTGEGTIKFSFDACDCRCHTGKFSFKKTVDEQFYVAIDFAGQLGDAESLDDSATPVIQAIDTATKEDATTTVIESGMHFFGGNDELKPTVLVVPVKAGQLGRSYKVKVVVDADDGFTKIEAKLSFKVV